jgi:hypothetical protein
MHQNATVRRARLVPLALAVLTGLVCLTGLAVLPAASFADDSETGTVAPTGGLKVHVDPQTGRFLETPPPDAAQGTPPPAASAPAIEVRPSTVPGGGFGFELPESLHPEIKATTTPDGKARVACGEAQK